MQVNICRVQSVCYTCTIHICITRSSVMRTVNATPSARLTFLLSFFSVSIPPPNFLTLSNQQHTVPHSTLPRFGRCAHWLLGDLQLTLTPFFVRCSALTIAVLLCLNMWRECVLDCLCWWAEGVSNRNLA